jgi:REP element-mobilizing transposase RayT
LTGQEDRAIQGDVRRGATAQLEFTPAARGGWGGRRAGASRKPGARPPIQHRRRRDIAQRHPAHVTVKLRPGLASLRSVQVVREIERSFRSACDRGDFRLVHYTLLRDHAHLLVEATNAASLARGMKAVGSRLARAVNRVVGRRGPVLAERFHLRVLRTPLEVRRALAYVLLNARRHARRVVRAAAIDPASSGRWFDGWSRRLAGSAPRPADAPVARPMTWLLRWGWRRHGLLDPDETPGSHRPAGGERSVARRGELTDLVLASTATGGRSLGRTRRPGPVLGPPGSHD